MTLKPAEALVLVAISLVGLIALAPLGRGAFGVAAIEILVVLGPTLWVWQVRKLSLGLDVLELRALVGGVLVGAGAAYLMVVIEEYLLGRVFPVPEHVKESLRRLIVPASGLRPLPVALICFALVPALAEEALFRGAVLPAFVARFRPSGANLIAAILFGAFHLSIYKMVPATLLGLAIGAVRLRTRSLWPAIAFHVTNNTLVVLALRHGVESPPPPATMAGIGLIAAASILAASGWLLSAFAPQRS